MQPGGNLVADTIWRTAEVGVTITAAADAGTCHHHRRRPDRRRGTLPRLHPPRETFVITLSADWLTCRSWGFPPAEYEEQHTVVEPSPEPVDNLVAAR